MRRGAWPLPRAPPGAGRRRGAVLNTGLERALTPESITPVTYERAAAALAASAAAGRPLRIVGGATKLAWGAPAGAGLHVHTAALDRTLQHNASDMTASFEAGVPLARAQSELAAHGQMLAIDPPDGDGAATLGGVFATADSGPLRHRYGQPRDLVLGITFALGDGTVAKAGSRVIKNVAGYDIAKLFTGSFGTLGMILSLTVRLHPLPAATITVIGATSEPQRLSAAAVALACAPLELEALDVAWRAGEGRLLARVAGAQAARRTQAIERQMRDCALSDVEVVTPDEELWARQRAGQRSAQRAIVRVACRPAELGRVLALIDERGGALVGRAALGASFVEIEPAEIAWLRRMLPGGAHAVVLDIPETVRSEIDVWGEPDGAALGLMRAVKRRFDPAAVCGHGVFVGGI